MVNVDSQMSGVTDGRLPFRVLHGRGGGSPRYYVCNAADHIAGNCPRGRGGRGSYRGSNRRNPGKVQVNLCTTMDVPPKNDVGTQCEAPHSEPKVDEVEEKLEFADQPVDESVTSTDVPPQIRIYPLQYVKVNLLVLSVMH